MLPCLSLHGLQQPGCLLLKQPRLLWPAGERRLFLVCSVSENGRWCAVRVSGPLRVCDPGQEGRSNLWVGWGRARQPYQSTRGEIPWPNVHCCFLQVHFAASGWGFSGSSGALCSLDTGSHRLYQLCCCCEVALCHTLATIKSQVYSNALICIAHNKQDVSSHAS